MRGQRNRDQSEEDGTGGGQRAGGQEDGVPATGRGQQRPDEQRAAERAHTEEGVQQVQGGATLARHRRGDDGIAQRVGGAEAQAGYRGQGDGEWPDADKGRAGGAQSDEQGGRDEHAAVAPAVGGQPAGQSAGQIADELSALKIVPAAARSRWNERTMPSSDGPISLLTTPLTT